MLGTLWGLSVLVLVVSGVVALRFTGIDVAGAALTTAGSLLLLGWAVVPVLAFGVDATLDPQRFAPFGLSARQLVPGLLLAGLVGVPGVATVVAAMATLVTWWRGPVALVVAALSVVIGVLTCVAASRATTTLASRLLASRRTRELGASAAVLAMIVVGPVLATTSSSAVELDDPLALLQRAAAVLGWTPLGWAWSAPHAAASGQLLVALGKLALAALLLVGVCAIWVRALDRALVTPPVGGSSRRRRSATLLDRLPATPTWAVAARCLRYWRRDPRYLTSVVGTLVLPLVLLSLALTGALSLDTAMLLLAPAVGGLLGWGQHNDVAYDSSAIWMHLATGVPGRADRLGRAAAVLLWGAPLTVLTAVVGCAVAERWSMLPAVLGLSLCLLGAGTGVSAVASALLPYPVPEPGGNPFQTPAGAGVATMIGQAVTSLATTVLAAPVLIAYLFALTGGTTAAVVTLLLGVVIGTGAMVAGIVSGGRLFERRGPSLLAALK